MVDQLNIACKPHLAVPLINEPYTRIIIYTGLDQKLDTFKEWPISPTSQITLHTEKEHYDHDTKTASLTQAYHLTQK